MVFDIFRRELEVGFDEGGLFLLTMHPHHIGHRSRIWILDEIIIAAKAKGSAWFATHAEIAAYCAAAAGGILWRGGAPPPCMRGRGSSPPPASNQYWKKEE